MKFTPKEMTILACLLATDDFEFVTTDRLHHALYGTRTAAPSKNAVYVFVTRLTKKLNTIGLDIWSFRGKGYAMLPEDKDRIYAEFGREYCRDFFAKNFARSANVVKR